MTVLDPKGQQLWINTWGKTKSVIKTGYFKNERELPDKHKIKRYDKRNNWSIIA